jgi:secretion/DNA translocation related TadE-like protein
MRPRSRRDEGFVTIAITGLALVLVAVAALVATLCAVAVARHRAAAAADLAALAAAGHAVEGLTRACHAARNVATAQGAVLSECWLDGLDVVVQVSVTPPGRLGDLGQARARARAGPQR